MKWIAVAAAWFSSFFEKPLVSRVYRRIDIRIVRFKHIMLAPNRRTGPATAPGHSANRSGVASEEKKIPMKMRTRATGVVIALAAACGGEDAPTAPTAPTTAPVVVESALPAGPIHVDEDGESVVDVAPFFSCPGCPLTYAADSSNPRIVTASVSRSQITLRPVSLGQADVTVTASYNPEISIVLGVVVRLGYVKFLGSWKPQGVTGPSVAGMTVRADDAHRLEVRLFGSCGPPPCDWGWQPAAYRAGKLQTAFVCSWATATTTISHLGLTAGEEWVQLSIETDYTDEDGREDRTGTVGLIRGEHGITDSFRVRRCRY